MNHTIRRIAVSGSAAVALLGGAAAITLADTGTASATEIQARIDRATGAPVNLPDGRTIHVRGLDNASYQADTSHHTAAITLAAASDDSTPGLDGITSGLTPDSAGSGSSLQNPVNGTQTDYNQQQIQTQAGGGTIGVGVVTIAILAIIVFYKVRHGGMSTGDAVIGGLLGIALSGTIVGSMGSSLTNSLVGSLGDMLGGLS